MRIIHTRNVLSSYRPGEPARTERARARVGESPWRVMTMREFRNHPFPVMQSRCRWREPLAGDDGEERAMALVVDTRKHDEARACVPPEVDGDKFSVPALPSTFLGRPRLQHALSAAAIAPLTVV